MSYCCYTSKNLTFFFIFLFNFFAGVEDGVILPTALQYLKRYNGDQFDLGLCLSAFSFSSLFASPLMGKWSDMTKNTKVIIIFANLWQIAGSFMYFLGISTPFIIGGRLVAGVGLGVIGCLFSDIVKYTNPAERSRILSRIMVGRQLGMIIGPALNILFLNINVKIGPFSLDSLSAPGLFMAISWFILQVLTVFFYKNLHEFNASDAQPRTPEIVSERTQLTVNTSERTYSSIGDSSTEEAGGGIINSPPVRIIDNSETGRLVVRLYDEYIRDDVVAVLCSTFTVFFMQTCLETLLTPFTRDYFGWSNVLNSALYAGAGLEIIIVFLMLSVLSKKIKDRSLLIIGLLGNLSTLVFLIIYLPVAVPLRNEAKDYLLFLIPVAGNVFSLPLIVLASITLLSKITSTNYQGLTQGIRRTFVGVACILGPNWAGTFYKKWYILVGSLIALLVMSLVMVVMSFGKLNTEHENNKPNDQLDNECTEDIRTYQTNDNTRTINI